MYAGSLFIQQTLGLNIYIGVAIILGMSTVFTLLGGLTTVIITDALAVVIMVVGGIVLCILGKKILRYSCNQIYGSEQPRLFHIIIKSVHVNYLTTNLQQSIE